MHVMQEHHVIKNTGAACEHGGLRKSCADAKYKSGQYNCVSLARLRVR